MSIYYGYYSEQQASQFGYSIYKNASGTDIKVTEVCQRPEPASRWPDLEFVGIVCDFVSSHHKESPFKFLKLNEYEKYTIRPIPIIEPPRVSAPPVFHVYKTRNVPNKNA